jgi:hypothetical protein
MAPPRKLTPKSPGEPIQEAENAEQATAETVETAPAAETPTTTETTMPAADHAPVAARRPGELPNATEIDAKTIDRTVLTQHGYVVPEM